MVFDKLENSGFYKGIYPGIDRAFQVSLQTDFLSLEDGRYDIDGDDLFFVLQRYPTRPFEQGRLEAHQKYIDLQLLVEGSEIIGYQPFEGNQPETEYDSEKDLIFYQSRGELTKLNISAGQFCIFPAGELHMPGVVNGRSQKVAKAVFKIKVQTEDAGI